MKNVRVTQYTPSEITEPVKREILDMLSLCDLHDHTETTFSFDYSLNITQAPPPLWVTRIDGAIVSFLSLFQPTRAAAELSGATLPAFRKRGIWNAHISHLKNSYLQMETPEHKPVWEQLPEFLFVCNDASKDGLEMLSYWNAVLQFSEFLMEYTGQSEPDKKEAAAGKALVRKAVKEDLPELIPLAANIFTQSLQEAEDYIASSIYSPLRQQYLLEYQERLIGIGSITLENNIMFIYGLGIDTAFRRQGFGKILLKELIKLAPDSSTAIRLEVDDQNAKALPLYTSCGFTPISTYRYFKL